MGIPHDSPQRVKAGLQFALSEASEEGHCYLPEGELIAKAVELLGVDAVLIEGANDIAHGLRREAHTWRNLAAAFAPRTGQHDLRPPQHEGVRRAQASFQRLPLRLRERTHKQRFSCSHPLSIACCKGSCLREH
jgi:hypothetical protein